MTLTKTGRGFCKIHHYLKPYVSCIEHTIPVWEPKGNVFKKKDFPKASLVFAVLMECEWIAKEFGSHIRMADGYLSLVFSSRTRARPLGRAVRF